MSNEIRYCPSCGAPQTAGNRFCPGCGRAVEPAAAEEPGSQATTPPASHAATSQPATTPLPAPTPPPAGVSLRTLVIAGSVIGVVLLIAVIAAVVARGSGDTSGVDRYVSEIQEELAPVSDANEALDEELGDLDETSGAADAVAATSDALGAVEDGSDGLASLDQPDGDNAPEIRRSTRDALDASRDYYEALGDALESPLTADVDELEQLGNDAVDAWDDVGEDLGAGPPDPDAVLEWIELQRDAEKERLAAIARKKAAKAAARKRAAQRLAARRRAAAKKRAEEARIAAANAPKYCEDYMYADGGRSANIVATGTDCGTATTVASYGGWPDPYTVSGFECYAYNVTSVGADYRCSGPGGSSITFQIGDYERFN